MPQVSTGATKASATPLALSATVLASDPAKAGSPRVVPSQSTNAQSTSQMSGTETSKPIPEGSLIDKYGRAATDLRVSLTDRCNLRCTYCMPEQGLEWLPGEEILTDEEMIRLINVAITKLHVREVRFTGGEPLLRPGLDKIIKATKAMRTDQGLSPQTALTTNAVSLDKRAKSLREAGLDRVNISLDTVDPELYASMTRRSRLNDVFRGLEAAKEYGFTPIKINSLVMRGINEENVTDLLRFTLQNDYHLRFIEHMPLGPVHTWDRSQIVTQEDIIATLSEHFTLTSANEERGSSPAKLWSVAAGKDHPAGDVGFIASVTEPFCSACDRTRLTADGQIRNCLFSQAEFDLRSILRGGGTDDDLAEAWRTGMFQKEAGHHINAADFSQPKRSMSKIGG